MSEYENVIKEILNLRGLVPVKLLRDKTINSIQELVDRAMPKKPEMQAMSGFRPYEANVQVCPCCKEMIVNVWNRADYKPNYCHYCGQALNWSDE